MTVARADGCGPVIRIVDDDPAVRDALSSLLRSTGLQVAVFSSGRELFDHGLSSTPGCIVLDVRMPGESGLDVLRDLIRLESPIPVVFITGHGDIPMAVEAMKLGAVEFLPKPFREHDLLDAVRIAVGRSERALLARSVVDEVRGRYLTLTEREREVLEPVVEGRLNKQVAVALGISEQTVKVHRHNIMRKMEARSLPDLVRMVEVLRTDRLR